MLKERIVRGMYMDIQPTPETTEIPVKTKKEALKPADQLQNDLNVMQSGKVLEGINSIMKNAIDNQEFKNLLTKDKINEVKNAALDALKTKSIPLLSELPMKAVQDALLQLNTMVAFTAPPQSATGDNTTQVAMNKLPFTAPPVGKSGGKPGSNFTAPPVG